MGRLEGVGVEACEPRGKVVAGGTPAEVEGTGGGAIVVSLPCWVEEVAGGTEGLLPGQDGASALWAVLQTLQQVVRLHTGSVGSCLAPPQQTQTGVDLQECAEWPHSQQWMH